MIIRNPRNLPEALVRAVSWATYKPNPMRMSVTDLIGSPLARSLKHKFYDQLEADVEDMTWAMLGTAFHMLMDKNAPAGSHSEKKIELLIDGYTLVGIPDIHQDGTLDDYKTTSVFSFKLGDKPDWERQLNVYRYMIFKDKGIEIKKLRIVAILRDWMKSKTKSDKDYPKYPLIVVDIPIWPMEYTEMYIFNRLEIHKTLAECTPEERWRRPTVYAVKKKGIKTSKRNLDSMEMAEAWIAKNTKENERKLYTIDVRPGEDSKCLDYCSVAKWCPCNIYNKEAKT